MEAIMERLRIESELLDHVSISLRLVSLDEKGNILEIVETQTFTVELEKIPSWNEASEFIQDSAEYGMRVIGQRACSMPAQSKMLASEIRGKYVEVCDVLTDIFKNFQNGSFRIVKRGGSSKALAAANASLQESIDLNVTLFKKLAETGVVFDMMQMKEQFRLDGQKLDAVCKKLREDGYYEHPAFK
jgi:hypothetical protein